MFGLFNKNKSTTTTGTGYDANAYGNNTAARRYKPYRNRPSKRQTLLEALSFGLILASAPAYLGGVFSIFICIATLILGLIGLFAWTRRHVALFALLCLAVIGACVVNIILRATFTAQCMPFYKYDQNFSNTGLFDNDNEVDDDDSNDYNSSIWCGNRIVVYVTHAIILALAIPALLVALTLFKKRNTTALPTTTTTTTKTTRTVATA
eukprot:TRINITY_DN154_c0_g1_i5.p1 TRINITY_DN154_c0_g1~~TRINITY_DN154_c0_g1_i5.p1  ORF type:complete len:208 (+),score=55.35 TRINITY_DN154_c0_g1_i5:567-1190(+)